jgi:hypothetical protein
MALEAAFAELTAYLRALHEALRDAQTTVRDRPVRDDVVLVDLLGDALDDALGWLDESLQAAQVARTAVAYPTNLGLARHHLITCQERFSQAAQRVAVDLMAYTRLSDLEALGQERRGEWRAWANSVHSALDGTRKPFTSCNQVLFRCWQELTERAIAAPLSPAPSGPTTLDA